MGPHLHLGRVTERSTSPRPAPKQEIVEGAEDRLRHYRYPALRNVSCDYHEGVLTLHGRVPSYYLKQMAQTAVLEIEGVERIINKIEVITSLDR